MRVSWQIDKRSLEKLNGVLRELEQKVQKKIVRKGLRIWSKEVMAKIKGNITWDDKELKRSIITKIKTLKKNKGFWIGVGVEGGKKVSSDSYWIATRARWFHDGFTPYPKGKKSGRTGKGWRRNLKNQGGNKIYNTQFVEKERQQALASLPQKIVDAIKEALA